MQLMFFTPSVPEYSNLVSDGTYHSTTNLDKSPGQIRSTMIHPIQAKVAIFWNGGSSIFAFSLEGQQRGLESGGCNSTQQISCS